MGNSIILHTHLGLGDMFICNGLVRKFVAENDYDQYYVVCKRYYMHSVEPMYSDDDRIIVVPIQGDDEYKEVGDLPFKASILRIGHENLNTASQRFDQSFYHQVGFTIEDKYSAAKVSRDSDAEECCYSELVPDDEEYIFVHDESSVGTFDLQLPDGYKVIKPTSRDYRLLDFLKVIENAKQVHCIDSSFLNMIDVIVDRDELYFHHIKHPAGRPTLKDSWTIINYENN
jgi:hypothetical protein